MTDKDEKIKELKEKNKALRNFLRKSEEENNQMKQEVEDFQIKVQQMTEEQESQSASQQRLIARIETLQNERAEQASDKSKQKSSWSVFGGGSGQLKEELEEATERIQIAEEELEAKIQENQQVHMRNFEIKQELQSLTDKSEEQDRANKIKQEELRASIDERIKECESLTSQLTDEKAKNESLEESKRLLKAKFESEMSKLQQAKVKLTDDIAQLKLQGKQRMPFDPFSSASQNALNVSKCEGSVRQKQVEVLERMKDLVDPLQQSGIPQVFEQLLKALKNQFDGSMPVFNEFDGSSSSMSGNGSIKKFVVYLERIIGIVAKLEEISPHFFSDLSDLLESIASDDNLEGQEQQKQAEESSLSLNLSNFSHYFNQLQEYLCNFLDEQLVAVSRTSGNDYGSLKTINDAISKSVTKIKQVLTTLHETYVAFQEMAFKDKAFRKSHFLFQICEEVLQLKCELQTIATQFKKKSSLYKGSGACSYETKSNNLSVLRDDSLQTIHSMVGKVDIIHQLLVQARSAFSVKDETYDVSYASQLSQFGPNGKRNFFNMQIPSQNSQLQQGQHLVSHLNTLLQNKLQGIPYAEQVAMMRRVTEQDKTIQQLQTQLSNIKRENQLLQESAKLSESSTGKLQSIIQVLQKKNAKSQQVLAGVSHWLQQQAASKAGSIISEEEKSESAQTAISGGDHSTSAVHFSKSLQALQAILANESDQATKNSQSKQQAHRLVETGHVAGFMQENQKDFYLFNDVFQGLQKWSTQVTQKGLPAQSSNDALKGGHLPLNQFVSNSDKQRLHLLQEKSIQKMAQMAQKMQNVNKLSKGSSLQVMEKDKEWKEKLHKVETSHQKQVVDLQRKVDAAEKERSDIRRNYDSQMKMLSEHLAELNIENERLKGGM